MIISVNDIPEMRAAFKGMAMNSVDIHYTVANNRRAKTSELIIRNW